MRMIGRRFQLSVRIVPEERLSPIKMRGLAIRKVAAEFAVLDDVGALRGHAFVVVGEAAEAGAVLEPRVGDDVDDVRAVAKIVQLIEGEKTRAGEIRFLAENAIEFDRMADGFVNLQAELAAAENQCAGRFGAMRGGVERDGFFGDPRRILDELHLLRRVRSLARRAGRRSCLDTSASESLRP